MAVTARRGEFEILREVTARKVVSCARTHGVTFSPSSSRSRLHVVDSGQRYEVRLVAGAVEISLNGIDWQPLTAGTDPWTGEPLPWGISYQNKRQGEPLKPVPFDMIAVGRGRLLAKEQGTDRIFHLKLDELFRTRLVIHADGSRWTPSETNGDPPVPSNCFRLDPEFFTPAGDGFEIPAELLRQYALHPASLRFPLFVEAMRAESSDGMSVPVKARVWQLIDGRSPLVIVDLDDLKCIGDAELRLVATRDRIRRVLENELGRIRTMIEDGMDPVARSVVDLTPSFPITGPIGDVIEDIDDLARSIDGFLATLRSLVEGIPLVGPPIAGIADAADSIVDLVDSLGDTIRDQVERFIEDLLASVLRLLAPALAQMVVDIGADQMREAVRKDGFAALFFPGVIVLGLLVNRLREQEALKVVSPADEALRAALEALGQSLRGLGQDPRSAAEAIAGALAQASAARAGAGCSPRSEMRLHIGKTLKLLLQDDDNPALRRLVQRLVEAGRRTRGITIPNAPPPGIPFYTHVVYGRVRPTLPALPGFPKPAIPPEEHERRSIAFRRVLDLGVGYSHWHEQWRLDYGGEMNNLLATRPLFQQERYNITQYRFLNGPVIDGDGYNDGTTNFYMLVELGAGEAPPGKPPQGGPPYAILWIDEQTYFTQRWRLLHPTRDTAGDLFSLQRVLRDNPEYFRFDPQCFWSPFEAGAIDETSRMAVVRQIVAVSGRDGQTGRPEIYTICFSYGVCDHTWRWRPFPEAAEYQVVEQALAGSNERLPASTTDCVYTNTLALREDTTLHVRGFHSALPGRRPLEGRWVQKYLPADLRHVPGRAALRPGVKPARGFDHDWDFVSEDAYRQADQFYLFGVYEPEVDARCQYYEVELLPDASGEVPSLDEVTRGVWRNEARPGDPPPLRTDTVNFNWALPRDEQQYVKLDQLTVDRGQAPTMSMYEPTTRFLLRERKPRGLIAVFYDKRDDELQPASHLPQETVFVEDTAPLRDPYADPPAARRRPPREEPRAIRLLVKVNHRVLRPPVVQKAVVTRVRTGGATTALRVSFWTSQTSDQVHENLWRVRLAALDEAGGVVPLFESEVFSHFQRLASPDRPLPTDFAMADVLRPEYQYEREAPVSDTAAAAALDRYCTPSGRVLHATSLWFEDIVGHRATPQSLEFAMA